MNPADAPRVVNRQLAGFTGAGYDKGRPLPVQVAWLMASSVIMCWWVPAGLRVAVLRTFGARIGTGVLIRHRVRVHWPWKLVVGDDCWIGEGAWILNLEPVTIGSNVCISQDVLLCTGSHRRDSPTFDFDNAAITVGDGAWLAVRSTVLRGVNIGEGAVVGAGALVTSDVAPEQVVRAPRGQ